MSETVLINSSLKPESSPDPIIEAQDERTELKEALKSFVFRVLSGGGSSKELAILPEILSLLINYF